MSRVPPHVNHSQTNSPQTVLIDVCLASVHRIRRAGDQLWPQCDEVGIGRSTRVRHRRRAEVSSMPRPANHPTSSCLTPLAELTIPRASNSLEMKSSKKDVEIVQVETRNDKATRRRWTSEGNMYKATAALRRVRDKLKPGPCVAREGHRTSVLVGIPVSAAF